MQVKAVIILPTIEIAIIWFVIEALIVRRIELMRRRPYLPNFRSTPARIIDPATGASTWALGSHRCTPYIGILTMKAAIIISHQRFGFETRNEGCEENMFNESKWWEMEVIPISRGREAVIV